MPFRRTLATLASVLLLTASPAGAQEDRVSAEAGVSGTPSVILSGVPFQLVVHGGPVEPAAPWTVRSANGTELSSGTVPAYDSLLVSGLVITVEVAGTAHEFDATVTPPWVSLLPPILAIVLALVFREVITALFAGVWLGALTVDAGAGSAAFGDLASATALDIIAGTGFTVGGGLSISGDSIVHGGPASKSQVHVARPVTLKLSVEPMTSVTPQRLKRRVDEVTQGDMPEAVLKNAPDSREGFFAVPKVVE